MIKGFCAAAMQSVIEAREVMRREFDSRDATAAESVGFNDAMRCYATALTHLEAAQMFAVKGLTRRQERGRGLMLAALLPLAGSLISKLVGGHLVENHLLRGVTGASGTLGALVGGLSGRFGIGVLVGLYGANEGVRSAINAAAKAIGAADRLPGVL